MSKLRDGVLALIVIAIVVQAAAPIARRYLPALIGFLVIVFLLEALVFRRGR